MPKISICIPFHDTPKTAFYLSRLLTSISDQTFKDYEIILTKEGNFARNHNAAIQKAKGEIVQMMQMDDYFNDKMSLQAIYEGFERGKTVDGTNYYPFVWQITGCLHDIEGHIFAQHFPQWTDDIWTGNNKLGSVSTLSFRREKALFFEEPLTWLVDVDLYYRLFLKYGEPNCMSSTNVVINTSNDRLSSTLSDEIKLEEVKFLRKKYGK